MENLRENDRFLDICIPRAGACENLANTRAYESSCLVHNKEERGRSRPHGLHGVNDADETVRAPFPNVFNELLQK